MSDHPMRHANPEEGFDRTEPNAPSIWGFTIGSVIILVLVIVAIQQYFFKIWNDAVTEKVLIAPDTQLQLVHQRDDWDLTHYEQDKTTKTVRIPVERAEDLFLQEVAAGKAFYPGKPTVPKPEEPAATPAAPGAPGAAPAAAPESKKPESGKKEAAKKK